MAHVLSHHQPFRVRFTLETAAIVSSYGLPLDTLLLNCLKMESGDSELDASNLDELLQKNEAGFYHASNMIFAGVHPQKSGGLIDTLVARTSPFISRPRYESDLCDTKIQPNGKNGKYTKIQLLGGVYKSRLDNYPSYWSRWAIFYGVGDIKRIESLLSYYILTLGERATGTVSNVVVEPIEEDQSILDKQGKARRTLPETFSSTSPLSEVVLAPPYSAGPSEKGYKPANVMFEYL